MKCFLKYLITFFVIFTAAFSTTCKENKSTEPPESLQEFDVTKNVEWANPNGNKLTMDIYVPKTGKSSYPVLVIFHGGGWLINNNSVMDSMSIYVVQHSEYIVCNVNYRLLPDESNTVTINQMVEDVMGSVLWIKENIAAYRGDKTKIILTGDSAGGHLAEMVVIGAKSLESDGFGGSSLGFNPTYLPAGKTAEDIAINNGLEVQAVILSYAAFDIYSSCLSGGFETASNYFWYMANATPRGLFGDAYNVNDNPEMYKAVSPIYNIPNWSERTLPPHFCIVGSKDNLITPASVQNYVSLLQSKGHSAEYWEHEGRPHAFLDSGKNDFLGTEFQKDAPPAIDRMIDFMNRILGN